MTEDQLHDMNQYETRLRNALNGLRIRGWDSFQILQLLRTVILDNLENLNIQDLPLEVRERIAETTEQVVTAAADVIDIPYIIEPFESRLENFIIEVLMKWLYRVLDLPQQS